MKTLIFGYVGPVNGLLEVLNEHIEKLDRGCLQDMGDCDITGYCTSSCRYYGSGCEII